MQLNGLTDGKATGLGADSNLGSCHSPITYGELLTSGMLASAIRSLPGDERYLQNKDSAMAYRIRRNRTPSPALCGLQAE